MAFFSLTKTTIRFMEDVGISLGNVISIISFLTGLVVMWVNFRVKFAKLETETNLKFENHEKAINENKKDSKENLKEFMDSNKEDHLMIMKSMKNIEENVTKIRIDTAK